MAANATFMETQSFPRGIELTCACIVHNPPEEILLVASVKQDGKWTLPGSHIEPGEMSMDAAIREVKEETGLDAVAIETIGFGELINPPDFHRSIHAVYFDCLLEAEGEIALQADELSDFIWVDTEKALTMDPAHRHPSSNYPNWKGIAETLNSEFHEGSQIRYANSAMSMMTYWRKRSEIDSDRTGQAGSLIFVLRKSCGNPVRQPIRVIFKSAYQENLES